MEGQITTHLMCGLNSLCLACFFYRLVIDVHVQLHYCYSWFSAILGFWG